MGGKRTGKKDEGRGEVKRGKRERGKEEKKSLGPRPNTSLQSMPPLTKYSFTLTLTPEVSATPIEL